MAGKKKSLCERDVIKSRSHYKLRNAIFPAFESRSSCNLSDVFGNFQVRIPAGKNPILLFFVVFVSHSKPILGQCLDCVLRPPPE